VLYPEGFGPDSIHYDATVPRNKLELLSHLETS
jgi:hypothetical protein